MFIQTEETPNPATLKFYPPARLPGKNLEFLSLEEASSSPLAQIFSRLMG